MTFNEDLLDMENEVTGHGAALGCQLVKWLSWPWWGCMGRARAGSG